MNAESELQFVDTNVLLYAYDRTADRRHRFAMALVGDLGAERHGALSVQVLQEFYVNVTRKIAEPLDNEAAMARVQVLARWPAHTPQPGDVVAAAELASENHLSFWDAMIIQSARSMKCRVLWTEDLNHGQEIAGVTIQNPFR